MSFMKCLPIANVTCAIFLMKRRRQCPIKDMRCFGLSFRFHQQQLPTSLNTRFWTCRLFSLKTQLEKDMVIAMRNRDKKKLEVIRSLRGAIVNKEKAPGVGELDDTQIVAILRSHVQQTQKTISSLQELQESNPSADELIQDAVIEKEIVSSYLPAMLSDDEIQARVRVIVESVDEKTPKNVIPRCMKELRSVADPKLISKYANMIIKEHT